MSGECATLHRIISNCTRRRKNRLLHPLKLAKQQASTLSGALYRQELLPGAEYSLQLQWLSDNPTLAPLVKVGWIGLDGYGGTVKVGWVRMALSLCISSPPCSMLSPRRPSFAQFSPIGHNQPPSQSAPSKRFATAVLPSMRVTVQAMQACKC